MFGGVVRNEYLCTMKRLVGIIVLGAMLLLTGCGGNGYTPELRAIDTIINEKPDSALHLLDSLSTEAAAWPNKAVA